MHPIEFRQSLRDLAEPTIVQLGFALITLVTGRGLERGFRLATRLLQQPGRPGGLGHGEVALEVLRRVGGHADAPRRRRLEVGQVVRGDGRAAEQVHAQLDDVALQREQRPADGLAVFLAQVEGLAGALPREEHERRDQDQEGLHFLATASWRERAV